MESKPGHLVILIVGMDKDPVVDLFDRYPRSLGKFSTVFRFRGFVDFFSAEEASFDSAGPPWSLDACVFSLENPALFNVFPHAQSAAVLEQDLSKPLGVIGIGVHSNGESWPSLFHECGSACGVESAVVEECFDEGWNPLRQHVVYLALQYVDVLVGVGGRGLLENHGSRDVGVRGGFREPAPRP